MYAYKDVLELAGHTTRLYTLFAMLHSLPTTVPFKPSNDLIAMEDVDIAIPDQNSRSTILHDKSTHLASINQTILVHHLNFELKAGGGEHLMITGTNGVGKTAIARVVAGLWAGSSGKLSRPRLDTSEVFVIPQRAYMVSGSLLDQSVFYAYPNRQSLTWFNPLE